MTEFVIDRRKLYMLPTRIGWYFTLVLIALFAIAIKYDSQAAFMMLFILCSISLVSMLYTHNNVIGLRLNSASVKPVFVGETAQFTISVHNQRNKKSHALWLTHNKQQQKLALDPAKNESLTVNQPATKRGYIQCPSIVLTSQYPIGLFFCWTKRYSPQQNSIVYPQPLDLIPITDNMPSSSNAEDAQKHSVVSQNSAEQDYAGMKAYQQGDRLRDIHWPSLAKTQKLVSITYDSPNNNANDLSWMALPKSFSNEQRLSQLCFWIIEAEKNNTPYQLSMPNTVIAFSLGRNHYHQCLSTLALWGIEQEH